MDEINRAGPSDEIEELQSVDELSDLEQDVNGKPAESPLLAEPGPRSLVRSFEKYPEPFALIDSTQSFVYVNPQFRNFLRKFAYPESSSFLKTFNTAFESEQRKDFLEALASPDRGYAWKETVSHKNVFRKEAGTVVTEVHVMPFWSERNLDTRPSAYLVYLDDETDKNKNFLRMNLESLLRASLQKDRDTGNHVRRVNFYSKRLAEALYKEPRWPQVDADFIENIGFLAAMHDVGKIGTPDDILNKEGPLDEFEWKVMKEHTINGAYILSSYPQRMAKEIALSHHEWWNGSGYPYNLEGTQIPLAARIVTLADVYDALRMKRSYKAPYPHEVAIQKIRQERGVHFDPELVDIVLSIEPEFREIHAVNAD
ncbi:MAG TPA: HD domain-containing phosphohydrolase [Rectinemataceae bacterium]|nr:HD domain-containing phosphohydrolase [Rectinemataceae bacterium]